ncbi:MAG: AI-2E family transporter [Myxococcales bacterium]|nr:AI-2E family transporter [Myxococcales bacterium]MCB9532972.1 AI-2E family transporter [Myxococcales bacterium]
MRRWLPALVLFAVFCAAAIVFPDLVLLFFVAVLVVYLIEPVVASIASRRVARRPVPRWAAVVAVYSVVTGATVAFAAVVLPQLTREAAGLADEVPRLVRHVRTTALPQVSDRLEALQRSLVTGSSVELAVDTSEQSLHDAVVSARAHALFVSALTPEERELLSSGALAVTGHDSDGTVLFRLRPGPDGQVDVLAGDGALALTARDDGSIVLAPAGAHAVDMPRAPIDLERALNDSFARGVEASGERVAEVLHLSQVLVTRLLGAVVALFITFMVAAFISIDWRRIVDFWISLFPDEDEPSVRRLLALLNLGLAGVIRGQLAICVVNGVLTAIGLLLLDVKFALLLACVATVMSLVPIFGTFISSVPMVLLAMTDGVSKAALVVAWIAVIHFIEANILHPKIVGTSARIHPVVIIFALLAGEHAAGPIGALVAVPTASICQTLFIFFRDEYTPKRAPRAERVDAAAPARDDAEAPAKDPTEEP